MKRISTESFRAWITCFLFCMILLCHRTDMLPFGKDLAQMIFENVAIRYDEILTQGLTDFIRNFRNVAK